MFDLNWPRTSNDLRHGYPPYRNLRIETRYRGKALRIVTGFFQCDVLFLVQTVTNLDFYALLRRGAQVVRPIPNPLTVRSS